MSSYVGNVTIGSNTYPVGSTLYGTCATAAVTPAKVVLLPSFDQLLKGVTIHVKFTNTNTAASPTLDVNSTGAKQIMRYGSTPASSTIGTSWSAGAIISFTYDGTYWVMNDITTTDLVTWNSIVDKPATYAPSSHTHPVNQLTWANGINLTCTSSVNNGEWSIDLKPGNKSGCYWHVWSEKTRNTILRCNADDSTVEIPYGTLSVKTGGNKVTIGNQIILVGNAQTTQNGCIEIFGKNTPFIDFHYAASGMDYTTREIATDYAVLHYQGKKSDGSNVNARLIAGAFEVHSSKHVKENVENITTEEAMKLMELRPVSFDYKYINEPNQRGLIAEEVLDIYPEMVYVPDGYKKFDPNDPFRVPSIDYSKFVPYLIKVCQIQEAKIEQLENDIQELKNT